SASARRPSSSTMGPSSLISTSAHQSTSIHHLGTPLLRLHLIPSALSGFSFPPAPPWSSVAPVPPRASGSLPPPRSPEPVSPPVPPGSLIPPASPWTPLLRLHLVPPPLSGSSFPPAPPWPSGSSPSACLVGSLSLPRAPLPLESSAPWLLPPPAHPCATILAGAWVLPGSSCFLLSSLWLLLHLIHPGSAFLL
ncbi:hypothetical protein M9458_036479, partial [Cirrhinus mrigala]